MEKKAYEVRISDWSSDVCSSDLDAPGEFDQVLGDHVHSNLSGRRMVAMACAAMPSRRPVKPSRSVVVALMLTLCGSTCNMPATRARIAARCGDRKSTRLNSSH